MLFTSCQLLFTSCHVTLPLPIYYLFFYPQNLFIPEHLPYYPLSLSYLCATSIVPVSLCYFWHTSTTSGSILPVCYLNQTLCISCVVRLHLGPGGQNERSPPYPYRGQWGYDCGCASEQTFQLYFLHFGWGRVLAWRADRIRYTPHQSCRPQNWSAGLPVSLPPSLSLDSSLLLPSLAHLSLSLYFLSFSPLVSSPSLSFYQSSPYHSNTPPPLTLHHTWIYVWHVYSEEKQWEK